MFENVKGLADPRNRAALELIMGRIREAGYRAREFLIDSSGYGVPQTRERIYIVGIKDRKCFRRLDIPDPKPGSAVLGGALDDCAVPEGPMPAGVFTRSGRGVTGSFSFNDLRDGRATIHSWNILKATPRQRELCMLLLRNRRKDFYGPLDGNPLTSDQFRELDPKVEDRELGELEKLGIFERIALQCEVRDKDIELSGDEEHLLSLAKDGVLDVTELRLDRGLAKRQTDVLSTLAGLEKRGAVETVASGYDFRNRRVIAGIGGVYRVFLPSSPVFPTLTASDANDYVTTEAIVSAEAEDRRRDCACDRDCFT